MGIRFRTRTGINNKVEFHARHLVLSQVPNAQLLEDVVTRALWNECLSASVDDQYRVACSFMLTCFVSAAAKMDQIDVLGGWVDAEMYVVYVKVRG